MMLIPQCYIDRMPKEVDHDARQRELADAASRVIARHGLGGTTLAQVAEEAGWSIGSIRYYFPSKDELVASALWRVGERIDDRIRRRTTGGMTAADLRAAAVELLPLDAGRARGGAGLPRLHGAGGGGPRAGRRGRGRRPTASR